MESLIKREISGDVNGSPEGIGRGYAAILRLSEVLSRCQEPEDLTEILSEELHEFLTFLQFYIIVYKENSTEVEWAVVGREKNHVASYADVPVQQRPSWQTYITQEPFHIHDWKIDKRIPSRLKEGVASQGLDVGPLVFVPLTTPHRRLGALGMAGSPGTVYTDDHIGFLRLIGRIVAFAIDHNFNLRQAETGRAELQRQNHRLQRSERELHEVIERIPDMAWTAAPDGSNMFVNRRWSVYTGLSLEDTAGSGWQIAVHPDDLGETVEKWRNSLTSGELLEHEVRFRHAADEQYRWFLVRGVPLRDESGEILKWYGTATDIEERKRAKGALGVLNNRTQLLLNLTTRITSNLDLQEVLRAAAANIREVMDVDGLAVSLPDAASGKSRVFAVDFPRGKGVLKEGLLVARTTAAQKALDTLRPVIFSTGESDEIPWDVHDVTAAEGIKAVCNIPVVNRNRVLAILSILRTTETPFTPEDVDFLTRASGQIAIAIDNCLAYQEVSDLKDKLAQEKLYLESEIRGEMDFDQIVGNSPPLKSVLQLVETVASADSTVLLLGETGTGKELIARAIHDGSRRKEHTLVKVNCAAIPTGLLESELFGHEKGAFTGAITQKIGRLELADQGTLFLDEVGDIPLEIQPKLLRALQEREFERLGSTRTRKVNVRVIAATNRDLEKMVAAREFRNDLYYRLNVFPIRIPPLRERKDDIPLLVTYFVEKFAKQMQKKIDNIPVSAMKALRMWEWPGNIRELENFVERAVILTRGRSLEAPMAELRKVSIDGGQHVAEDQDDVTRIVKETIKALHSNGSVDKESTKKQRDAIVRALTQSKGRVGGPDGAAERIGVNRTTLLARIRKFDINPRDYI